jgi:hypothetical protein
LGWVTFSQRKQFVQTFPWDFLLAGIEVKAAQMKENIGLKPFNVPIPIGLFHQRLDFVVQSFHGPIGDPVGKERQDIRQVPLAWTGQFLDRFQA